MTESATALAPKLQETAQQFFEDMSSCAKLQPHLIETDHIAQFVPKLGEPFFVMVQGGKLQFGRGAKFDKDIKEGLYIVEVQDCFDAILHGEISFGEAIFFQKIRIPGYRNKEPAIARFSKFLRLGIWELVPGSPILKPKK